jgi:hypothetical protein
MLLWDVAQENWLPDLPKLFQICKKIRGDCEKAEDRYGGDSHL